jgi:hypothetical protein
MFRFFYQHNNSAYCGNGSEIFRFLLRIVCVEAKCFASFTNTTIVYIVGMEAKHFASCPVPIVCMEARCFFSFTNTTIVYIVGMEAKHFASCCPLTVWKRDVSLLLPTQQYCVLWEWKRNISLLVHSIFTCSIFTDGGS